MKALAIPMLGAILVVSSYPAHGQSQKSTVYTSSDCGFRIVLPPHWVLLKPGRADACKFPLKQNGQQVGYLQVSKITFEAAAKAMDFELQDGKWMLRGEGQTEATVSQVPAGKELVSNVAVREYSKEGYVGLGDETHVVVADDERHALLINTSLDEDDAELDQLIKDFRFISPAHY